MMELVFFLLTYFTLNFLELQETTPNNISKNRLIFIPLYVYKQRYIKLKVLANFNYNLNKQCTSLSPYIICYGQNYQFKPQNYERKIELNS